MHSGNIYDFKWGYLFVFMAFIYLALAIMTNGFVLTDSFYDNIFIEQLGSERVKEIIEMNKKAQILSYVVLPIFLLLKLVITAGIIYAGLFLANQNVLYKDCFKIVMAAEIVPILVILVKLIHFLILKPTNILEVQLFYPLSITEILNFNKIPSYLIYPLQQLNLFEVSYWLLIAAGIKTFAKKTFSYSIKIVAASYGVALIIWVLCVAFIQLQFN
ncbi:MAG TPA: hypothetical protein VIH61_02125 [Waddliaceae bacterium]